MTTLTPKTHQLHIYGVTDETRERLRRLAEADRRPVSEYVRLLIERHVEEPEGEVKG